MLLAIDIGNTNISIGLLQIQKEASRGGRIRLSSQSAESMTTSNLIIQSWRLATYRSSTVDEYGTKILDLLQYSTIERNKIKAVAIASVVPPLTPVFEELSQKYFKLKAFVIKGNDKFPMPILYDNPQDVGADRIVNAIAAYSKFGGPCIIVDFGTATTFDCVTKKGEYAGGLIVPGPALAAETLSLHTAKLPKVEIAKPNRLIGKNTVESIQSGLYYGYLSLIDGLLDRLKNELGTNTKIVVTGGLASLIVENSKHIKKEMLLPNLTLEGISMVWEKLK